MDYSRSHDVGDEMSIPALTIDHAHAVDAHEVELYSPPASAATILKWKCERCKRIYADPKQFEFKSCIPFGMK